MGQASDGGYYALKGFLYQFDKTLIEILENPDQTVMFEHREDIDLHDFVIQVKHKETQDYQSHKIRKPIVQLIELFKADRSQEYCPYCHFRDQKSATWILTLQELDAILGKQKNDYACNLKEEFINSFRVQFSEDFESQFLYLLDLIRMSFSLMEEDRAFIYHSWFRSKLLDLSLKPKDERLIEKADLDGFAQSAEQTVFYGAYSKYLDRKRYERLVKSEYFTFKDVNLNNFERLFIVDCDEQVSQVDLNKIVNRISTRYYRSGKSPQPFLCFVNLGNESLKELKRDLIDQGVMFNDGTYFNGDRFRLVRIIQNVMDDAAIRVKIIDRDNIDKLLSSLKIQEIYQLYVEFPLGLKTDGNHVRIQMAETSQVLQML